MLDFLRVSTRKVTKRNPKREVVEIFPKFIAKKSNDLMIRGKDFYAIWDEEKQLWQTEKHVAIELIDRELDLYFEKNKDKWDSEVKVMHLWDTDTGMIDKWIKYCTKQMPDDYHQLDEKIIFSNDETNKKDYASKRLDYPLEAGDFSSYEKLISTLYSEEERRKIEWAIGSIITGDSKKIQKFVVLYGSAGTGKSTVLNIIQQLFKGYYSVFDAKALGSTNGVFALESFRTNPLVAIQHDGDLSRIEDNTRLNSLVAHERMTVNEKFKSTYTSRFNSFLFMGTNKPVKITDAKSGLIRRLIDVSPTGETIDFDEYQRLVHDIRFELGAIASHCRDVYLEKPGRYDAYIPVKMLGASNDFYNFIFDSYFVFKEHDGTTLKAAWEMYQEYCDESNISYKFTKRVFKEELKNYFYDFNLRHTTDEGKRVRSYYSGFRTDIFFGEETEEHSDEPYFIALTEQPSLLDVELKDCPAQYASKKETPSKKWDDISTTLSDLDTSRVHYVRVPENHIVIDFDIPDKDGNKDYDKNLTEASKWPPTYTEVSKSGKGIHLHYIYTGDVSKLSRVYDNHVEVKVFTGKSSLRRKLTKCNDIPIKTLSSGLPLKGDKKIVNKQVVTNEKNIRHRLVQCMKKQHHGHTKPEVDFIFKILEEAYENEVSYDVSDMKADIITFAAGSTHQSDYCLKLVKKMKFVSKDLEPEKIFETSKQVITWNDDSPIVFYDVEVFPNLLLVNWKYAGENCKVVRLINPSPTDIEYLLKFRLVGFNCRRYDNHILWARLLGYSNEKIYDLSSQIIGTKKNSARNCYFREAYNLSYTDVYDFCSKKQSLKKWEIELDIHHKELGIPWDKPVPEERWVEVAEYCDNDVIATEAVFNARQADFTARMILADLAGTNVNATTNTLTTKIIFGNDRNPPLEYVHLEDAFPGYEFIFDAEDKKYHNMYRGVDLGFGGYVYAEPGIHKNVALLDISSMHPTSIVCMNMFGKYTKNFKDLLDARIAIKHGNYNKVRRMFGGKLKRYLNDEKTAQDLAQALKIAINSVYGLTSAKFDNPFRDIRNKNNIVALRGALFMKTLQDEVVKRGYSVAHIKTDSIKIPDADKKIINFCMRFAKKYGYEFEHEATYEKMCLVNDAVYVAKYDTGEWTATGTQFQVPYVFKTLFSHEPIEFKDMCETKSVTSALYLDMNEDLESNREYLSDIPESKDDPYCLDMNEKMKKDKHSYVFVGRVGRFCPMQPGAGGGILLREGKTKDGDIKYDAATGSKGYRWLESETVKLMGLEDKIDKNFYISMVDDAVDAISKYGDFEWFIS